MPPEQFFAIFSENTIVFKKFVQQKNIRHLISDDKAYIHFWCQMTPPKNSYEPQKFFS